MDIGIKVVRGPDWSWEDEDGGEGYTGTLYDLNNSDKTAIIQWDNGNQTLCKIGQMNTYDLRIIDNAQIGVKHRHVECDGCGSDADDNLTNSTGITYSSGFERNNSEDVEHIDVRCNECKSVNFRGIRYKCANCYDYDLCELCYLGSKHDLRHSFIKINSPNFEGIHLLPRYIQRNQEQGIIHRGVNCDGCKAHNMRGTRYKCSNCHNYDLCVFCYHGNKHALTHTFVKIDRPNGAINELPPRITFRKSLKEGTVHTGVRCDECDFDDIRGIRYKCKNCYNYDLCFLCYHRNKHDLSHTFIRVDMPYKRGVYLTPRLVSKEQQKEGTIHRDIECDGCNVNNIKGTRYSCNVCVDYDLCKICYFGNKHDLGHNFRRIDTPNVAGINLPPRSNSGTYQGIGSLHTGIHCDVCGCRDIRGIRYKCNACHNYDLCMACYNANKHNVNHSFKRIDCRGSVGVNLPPQGPSRTHQKEDTVNEILWDVSTPIDITGMRYKCNNCDDYDLCYKCYHGDKHHLGHSFIRFEIPRSEGVLLPQRSTSRKCPLRGIFRGAKVVKGIDWDNGDRERDEVGVVLAIREFNTKSSWRSAAYVKWPGGDVTVCRLGYKGHCDIQFVEAALGSTYYYPEHLPILGKTEEQMMAFEVIQQQQVTQNEYINVTDETSTIEHLSLNDGFQIIGSTSENIPTSNSTQTTTSDNRVKQLESKIAQMEESQTCPICMENKRDVVFLCGHGTCSICAHSLVLCHLCRKTIEKKIRIY